MPHLVKSFSFSQVRVTIGDTAAPQMLFELRVQDSVSIVSAFRTPRPGLCVHLYSFSDFASKTPCPSLVLFGLRVHLYNFSDFASRTPCPSLVLFGLRVQNSVSIFTAFRTSRPGLRVHLYSFSNSASGTPCPSLVLFGLRVRDSVSIFTAFRTLRPRPRVHLYSFSDSASRTPCPSLLLLRLRVRTPCPSLQLFGLRVQDSVSISAAFRTPRPSLLLFGLRVQDSVSISTAFRTPRPGLRVHPYCFSDFVSKTLCSPLQLFGLRVHLYSLFGLHVQDSVSTFTAFRTPCPSLLLFGLRIHLYYFPDFVSIFTTRRTSRPYLPLSRLRVRCIWENGQVVVKTERLLLCTRRSLSQLALLLLPAAPLLCSRPAPPVTSLSATFLPLHKLTSARTATTEPARPLLENPSLSHGTLSSPTARPLSSLIEPQLVHAFPAGHSPPSSPISPLAPTLTTPDTLSLGLDSPIAQTRSLPWESEVAVTRRQPPPDLHSPSVFRV
ncbi:hypothetical protein CRG98_006632 [Punica granatum]|uniref:Uncharacterized protein n=1 Tax=Punica granatum TaxID=22663 RepID=A0A2I0KWU1_PUNGR|nr:hypothetical protein CRG98_006632 [Punica granatum]